MNLKCKKYIFPICLFIFFMVTSAAVPAFADISIIGELTHDYSIKPGLETKGKIIIKNKSRNEKVSVRISPRDYSFNSGGETFYMKPGSLERSCTGWLNLERSLVHIPPDSIACIHYTLAVPDNEKLIGTYWCIIIVEPVATEIKPDINDEDDINVAIQEIVRFGIQIVASIPDTGKKEIEFTSAGLMKNENEEIILSVDLSNTGERWLRPDVWVDLYSNDGSVVGRFTGIKKRLFPETSVRQYINLGVQKPGKYIALIVTDDGDEYIVGAEYKLKIDVE
jgi:hypothetical protein